MYILVSSRKFLGSRKYATVSLLALNQLLPSFAIYVPEDIDILPEPVSFAGSASAVAVVV